MPRQINPAGLALIESFETKRSVGYLPTPNDRPTAGYGHTGPDVEVGVTYDDEQILAWLDADLEWAEDAVERHATVPLNDNQFAALVSITFNIGATNFDSSTLLRDMNAGDTDDAAAQFLVWDKQRGVKMAGLDRRRQAERALFLLPETVDA